MTARPIGSIRVDGRVACNLCRWSTADRVDPVGALTEHRTAEHPDDQGRTTAPAPDDAVVPRRDAAGATIASLFIAAAYPAWLTWTAGGWYIAAAIPLTLVAMFGVYGLAEALQRRPRDRRGIAQTRK
jgi:hypothetical protein